MPRNAALFLCCLIVARPLCGLDPQRRITQYTLNTWKTERGLPSNSVLAIAQDRSGYLWLGTTEGLARFDGMNFSVFDRGSTPGFRDQAVNNLLFDRRGGLWIATYRGDLLRLEGGKFRRVDLPQRVSSIYFHCLAEDGRGRIWVGTANGLFFRPPGEGGAFARAASFPSAKIICLGTDPSGRLLVGTAGKGIYVDEDGRWQPVLAASRLSGETVYAVRPGRDGALWFGTDNGLNRARDGRWLRLRLKPGLSDNMTSLLEDRDGNVWAGSEQGLIRWQHDGFAMLDKALGLGGNYVSSLLEDRDGSLWVGTFDGGLTQVCEDKLTTLTAQEGLVGGVFRSLHEDRSGGLWIGASGDHLNRFQGGRCRTYRFPARFAANTVYSLAADGEDSLWLGTALGLLRFRRGRFEGVPLPGAGAAVEVNSVLRDHAGRLWAGTGGAGLFRWQRQGFQPCPVAPGLALERIKSLFEDRRGDLWIGCENGLAVMPGGDPLQAAAVPELDGCEVACFYEDRQGALWVGTRNQGLKVRRQGAWGSLDIDRGFFDNRVHAILEDERGDLWLSSENGLFQAARSELTSAAFAPGRTVRGRLFNENDGMRSRICNFGNPAGVRGADGRLWFANLEGAVCVDPARLRRDGPAPPVLLEEVRIDDRSLPLAGGLPQAPLDLAAGSRRFAFTYTALSLVRSDRVKFKYQLEGYDRDWVAAGNRRQAFYNDLRPGRYRFRVIAANADGVWNTSGAAFAFRLRPFVYQTGWFLALAALAFAALSAFLWQVLRRYLRAVTFWKKKTQIGHFKILATLGSGGMATVYKAQDLLDRKRMVALKVLSDENFSDEVQRRRFKHEALITEDLVHPHIVRIIERGEMEDCWYIAMELLPGTSLARLIRERGRLALADALEIMRQIVDALGAIHARQIVHRDLKPENIMVSERDGRPFVKLLDFGLAITPAQSRLTMSGVVMGTIRYLPPERIRDGVSSAAGDIYSAGIILYEMLTGAKPFWSEATGEVIHRILETYPAPAREINPDLPPELGGLISAMIDKEPARRPSLDTIAAELNRLSPNSDVRR